MNVKEFTEWSEKFDGIDHALYDMASGITFDEIVEKIESISIKPLGFKFLATIPIALYSGYVSPRVSVVLSDGCFCNLLGEQTFSGYVRGIEKMKNYVSWQEDIISCPEKLGPLGVPVAMFFIGTRRYDVNHCLLVLRSGGSKIESLRITVYQPQLKDFDLEYTSLEIAAAFKNGRWDGVEDLENRIETGVGCGGSVSNSVLSFINSMDAIQ